MSKSEAFLSIRLGHLVEALDSDGQVIKLGYEPAEQVIANLIERGSALSVEIFDRVDVDGFSLCGADTVKHLLKEKGLRLAKTARTSHVLPAVDLDDVCMAIRGQHFLVRPSLTVCASYGTAGGTPSSHQLPIYSKIWFRFIALGQLEGAEKRPAEDVYQIARDYSEYFFASATKLYEEVISETHKADVRIRKVGQIGIYSDNIDKPQFLDLVNSISCATATRAPKEIVEITDENFSRISSAFLKVDPRKLEDDDVLTSPVPFLRALRKSDPTSAFKLVSVNDREGYQGVYLARIYKSGATFVGLASSSFGAAAEPGVLRPSKSAANVVTAIVANDLVIGL